MQEILLSLLWTCVTWTLLLQMALTIGSICVIFYNMHGFSQGRPAIDELINRYNHDIIAVQEHWLTPTNLSKFDDAFPGYYVFGSSAMSSPV